MKRCGIKRGRSGIYSLIAGIVVAISGCAPGTGTGVGSATPTGSSVGTVARPSPMIEILSWDETQKRREQFPGKIVVLDVWSTYCDPCVREFPNLIALQKQFDGKVVCISFNTDYSGAKDEPPESFRPLVLKFLTARQANDLVNVISSDPSEELYTKIRLGGPPAVYVYGRDGKLAKRFDNSKASKGGEFTYKKDVIPFVEKLLTSTK